MPPVVLFGGVLIVWQFVAMAGVVPALLLPSPVGVAEALWENRADLLDATGLTLVELAIGFSAAIVIGIAGGAAFAYSRIFRMALYPLLVGLQAAPKIAVVPLVLLWLGSGIQTAAVIAFVLAVFPMVVNTEAGLRRVPRELHELARSLRSSALRTFYKIDFPSALPSIFAGLKIGAVQALTGVVVAQVVRESGGLGFVMIIAASHGRASLAFSVLVVLVLIGVAVGAAILLVERIAAPWIRTYSD